MEIEISFKGAKSERSKPWWKRRRVRAIAAVLTGVGLTLICSHLPEAYQAVCKGLSKILELAGAA